MYTYYSKTSCVNYIIFFCKKKQFLIKNFTKIIFDFLQQLW